MEEPKKFPDFSENEEEIIFKDEHSSEEIRVENFVIGCLIVFVSLVCFFSLSYVLYLRLFGSVAG